MRHNHSGEESWLIPAEAHLAHLVYHPSCGSSCVAATIAHSCGPYITHALFEAGILIRTSACCRVLLQQAKQGQSWASRRHFELRYRTGETPQIFFFQITVTTLASHKEI